MRSPFRDDEHAAQRSVEELWCDYEEIGRRLARAEADIRKARVARWIWTVRLTILGFTFVAAYFAGYYSTSEGNTSSGGLEGALP